MPTNSQNRTVRRSPVGHSVMTDALGRHLHLQSHDLKNTRDLRSLLLEAAYELQAQPDLADAQIYLFGCTLVKKRVDMEFEQFKSITRPQITGRILVHDVRSPRQSEQLAMERPELVNDLTRKPSKASQEAVVAYLLQRHLQFLPGVSINTIVTATKASLPTIYNVLKTFAHCIDKDPEDKTLRLRYFANNDWLYWIQRTNQLSSVYFIDRSGSPRSGTRLAKGLAGLQREDLAIGGLMGALHHLPALDATISPVSGLLTASLARRSQM